MTWVRCRISRARERFAARAVAALTIGALVVVAALTLSAVAQQQQDAIAPAPPATARAPATATDRVRVRVGTYDSRAVAIAYGRSGPFRARAEALHEQHTRARDAGDHQAADRLAREGQALQVRLHLQGFSNAPIDEILAEVRDRLPAVARGRDVVAIVPSTAYRDDARVEIIDVTDDLAAMFDPDEKTKEIIADLRQKPALPIEQVAQMDHKKH